VSEQDPRVAFCHREHRRLVGALTLYCGDAELARDLAQEALARACRDWSKVSRMAAPGAYVHRIAINLAHRHLRRRRLESTANRRALDDQRAAGAGAGADIADRLVLRQAVAALPPRQRTALILRYYSDLPVAEVAALMRCREGTVKALTHQAIASLRDRSGLRDLEEVHDA